MIASVGGSSSSSSKFDSDEGRAMRPPAVRRGDYGPMRRYSKATTLEYVAKKEETNKNTPYETRILVLHGK
ncbi:hypothetical protein HAX54_023176, partial [Datura stramonium]|nr:hypothetical protein [Datura stramonium]